MNVEAVFAIIRQKAPFQGLVSLDLTNLGWS